MPRSMDQATAAKVARAKALYAEHAQAILSDAELSAKLSAYRDAIARTWELMRQEGIPAVCGACASREPGSCCFHGIEEGFDEVLLLINLLMGCDLSEVREDQEGCFFVGNEGCSLLARTYFCVHYLCPELKALLGPPRIEHLLRTVGEEVDAGWQLELALRGWMKERWRASAPLIRKR